MDSFRLDIRHAFRFLTRRPGWTVAALLTLALGLGATTAIYGVVHGVLLRPLPYPDADRLVSVWQVDAATGQGMQVSTYPWYEAWLERQHVLVGLGAYASRMLTLNRPQGAERVAGAILSASVLETLRVRPTLGRRFLPEDDVPGAPPVVMLGYPTWQRRFGGRRDVIGSTVTIAERPRTVVGVLPEGFELPAPGTEFWLPLAAAERAPGTAYLSLLARLPAGVNLAGARSRLAAVTRPEADDEGSTAVRLAIRPLRATLVGDAGSLLLVLFGAVGVLLLVATLNVANLMLVRAAERERELSVRAALGAGRWRLVRLHLVEGLVLALLAAVLGVTLAVWLLGAFAGLGPDILPRASELSLDGGVLGFAMALTLVVALVVGAAPALHAGRPDLGLRLRSGGLAGSTGAVGSGNRLRSALVVAQITLATVLLAAGGLLLRSFVALDSVDAGFQARRVAAVETVLPHARYPGAPQIRTYYGQLMGRLAAAPQFAGAALVSFLPFRPGRSMYDLEIEGVPAEPGPGTQAELLFVSPSYFQVMGVPLRRGRLLAVSDREGGLPVVVVSETLARQHWRDQDPVGQRIRLEDDTWRTVVGVVGETRQHGLNTSPTGLVYLPYTQAGGKWPFGYSVLVHTADGLGPAAAAARSLVASLDPGVAVARIRWLDDWRAASVAPPRLRTWIIGAFATLALILAVIGLYGVTAYAVTRRTREVGLRIALGATRPQIVANMLRHGVVITASGLALGLAGALLVSRFLAAYLFGVGPRDPATLAGIAALLGAASLAAAWLPARRASRLEPAQALRTE